MRILVAHPGPAFSVQDVYAGWVEALRDDLGQSVFEFNLGDRLAFYSQVMFEAETGGVYRYALDADQAMELAVNGLYASILKVRPHLLVLVSAFFVPTDLIRIARDAGVRVVVLHTESPYEDDRQIRVAEHADLNLINDPTNLERFRAVAPTHYLPHAYRPNLHRPDDSVTPDTDLFFAGTGYPSRIRLFEAMNLDGLTVALGGNWSALRHDSPLHQHLLAEPTECLDNAQVVPWYHRSRVGLNLYRQESEDGSVGLTGWAMGPREVEMAACGLFFLRDARGEGDELLGMLPTFTDADDASEQLRWWLARDDERAAAADKAREAVAERTFANNARRMLRLLE